MLDLDLIRSQPERVRQAIRDKGVPLDLDELLHLDAELRSLRGRLDAMRAERNRLSARFKEVAEKEERVALLEQAADLRRAIQQLEVRAATTKERLGLHLLWVPNLPAEDAPQGADAEANVVVRKVGAPTAFDFEPQGHVDLLEQNDWAELARVSKVCGARSYALKGRLAMLEQVLWLHAAQRLMAEGFTFLTVPSLAPPARVRRHRPLSLRRGGRLRGAARRPLSRRDRHDDGCAASGERQGRADRGS